jgi:hypothetical protein
VFCLICVELCCCIEIEGKGLTSVQLRKQSGKGFGETEVVIHQSVKDNALYVVNQKLLVPSGSVGWMDANNAEARKHDSKSSMCFMQR